MDVQKAKNQIPFGLLLLLLLTTSTYLAVSDGEGFLRDVRGSSGWFCGPCSSSGVQCGEDPPVDKCVYDPSSLSCVGFCEDYCPHGGDQETCLGIIWTCTQTYPACNYIQRRSCKPYFYGPPNCRCSSTTGPTCGIRGAC